MNIYIKQIVFLILILLQLNLNAKVLHVGAEREYSSLTQALSAILPGDTVLVYEGIYPGGFFAENLKGTESAPISVFASGEVIFQGGSTAWQLTDAAFVHIRGFIFQKQTGNGVNFDDGGSYQSPSHHIIVEDCTFRDMQATGNNDLLKMSGVDDFEIRNCRFLNGSPGGSGIDMVGCHNGIITNCHFENQGSNSIQAKGGTSDIRIEANLFNNGGQRTLNLGGSTGLSYFRPVDARFEAARLKVYSNVIIGSQAAVAFVGCIDCEVVNNTIYLPDKWILRILQETVDITRFAPCGQNIFRNNIVVRDNRVSTDCNIGGNTDPQSFIFSNNLWYNPQNNNWPGPSLPVMEENISVGKNPLFVDENAGDFSLQNGSPAIANGYNSEQPVFDFNGAPFDIPRSAGAFEKTKFTGFQDLNQKTPDEMKIFPNPGKGDYTLLGVNYPVNIEVFNLNGNFIYYETLSSNVLHLKIPAGIYFLKVNRNRISSKTVKIVQL